MFPKSKRLPVDIYRFSLFMSLVFFYVRSFYRFIWSDRSLAKLDGPEVQVSSGRGIFVTGITVIRGYEK